MVLTRSSRPSVGERGRLKFPTQESADVFAIRGGFDVDRHCKVHGPLQPLGKFAPAWESSALTALGYKADPAKIPQLDQWQRVKTAPLVSIRLCRAAAQSVGHCHQPLARRH